MRFRVEHRVPQVSADALYRAFREHSLAYLRHLPAIEGCEPLGEGDGSERRVRWRARESEVPAAVRPFVRREDLQWMEETRWDDAGREARSRITRPGSDRLHCDSVIRFHEAPGGAVLTCEGDLRIRLPLVGGLVEEAAVSVLRERLGDFFEEFARKTMPLPLPVH